MRPPYPWWYTEIVSVLAEADNVNPTREGAIMAAREEHEGKSATHEKEGDAGEAAPSKLKLVGHYAMLGIGPLLAIVALVVAVMALSGNRASEQQATKAVAAAANLEKSLEATRNELERLKLSIAQEKNGQNEERRQREEREAKIVQNITQVQAKLKISPTLEQQLQAPASAPAAASAAAAPAAAAPAASKAGATGGEKKFGPEAQAIKESIEKFNR
jgi:hypothetical protein